MKRTMCLLVVWLALAPGYARAQAFIYHRDIGATVVLGWVHDKACPTDFTFYAFQFKGTQDGTTNVKLQGQTVELQVPIQAAFEGQLFYEVRAACVQGTTYQYSVYASSKDPAVAVVDGAARAWVVSYDLAPPSEVLLQYP